MKRVRNCILLLLVIGLLFANVSVSAAVNQYEGVFTYQVKDGEAAIVRAERSNQPLIIPDTLGGYPVTSIGPYAFELNTQEPYLIVPASVKKVDPAAFENFHLPTVYFLGREIEFTGNLPKIKSLYVHEGVLPNLEDIDREYDRIYFEDYPADPLRLEPITEGDWCYALWNEEAILLSTEKTGAFTVPEKLGGAPVTYIGPLCFQGEACSVTLPDTVKSIGSKAFGRYGSATKHLTRLPSGLKRLGNQALYGCIVDDMTLPSGLERIGEGAFYGCRAAELTIPGSVTYIGNYAFYHSSDLTEVTIEDGAESVGDRAFCDCPKLTKITIPGSVTHCGDCLERIGYGDYIVTVYGDADSAAYVYCGERGIVFLDRQTGMRYEKPHETTIDGVVYRVYPHRYSVVVDLSIGYARDMVIPELVEGTPVTSVQSWAFLDGDMTSVTLPDTVTLIGEGAFHDCSLLTRVKLPSELKEIQELCFVSCPNLHCLCIPDGIETMGDDLTDNTLLLVSSSDYVKNYARRHNFGFIQTSPEDTIVYENNAVCKVVGNEAILAGLIMSKPGGDDTRQYAVPDEVEGYPVVGIAGDAVLKGFWSYTMILGANVRYVEEGAIEGTEVRTLYTSEALESLPENLLQVEEIYGISGSYAQSYADAHDIAFHAVDRLPFTDVPEGKWYYPYVHTCYWSNLMQGTSQTTFAPQASASRAMLVTVLWRMCGYQRVMENEGFRDVVPYSWYSDAVYWASENGIVYGVTADTFAPNTPVTREQTAAILYRAAALFGADVESYAPIAGFGDEAKVSAYARSAMMWAVEAGIFEGDNNKMLNPKKSTTRAEMAAILVRYLRWLEEQV